MTCTATALSNASCQSPVSSPHPKNVTTEISRTTGTKTALLVAALVLAVALFHCGAPLTGERFVRFLGAASIAGVALVMLLSFKPIETMQPVRIALKVARVRR